jgi:hypothetical protein
MDHQASFGIIAQQPECKPGANIAGKAGLLCSKRQLVLAI